MARRVDYSFGPGHGPVSGVVNAAGAALAFTMVAELADVTPVWGLAAGAFAAAGATIASLMQDAPGKALAYRALCWLAAGGWSMWGLSLDASGRWPGPWTSPSLLPLLIGTVFAGFVGWGLQYSDKNKEEKRQQEVAAELARIKAEDEALAISSEHGRIAVEWQAEIRRQTRKDVTIVGVEFWEPNTGFTIDAELPADGTTMEDIKPYEKTLASAMDVPNGCGVEVVDPGISRRIIHIRVGTEDALAQDHHLPEGCEPDSIENDLSMGIRSDRSEATVNVRYNNMVLVGQVDSGKSNQLNVLTRQLVRCTDALVWAIDLTGNGRYPRPWARAWKEGRAENPAIDWIAPNADEATLMTRAAMAIIEGRTADYEQLMFEQGWDKIMVSPEIPEIVIVTDEFGSLPDDVKDNLQQISDTGRGAGVRVVSCALEATGRYIPNQLITQARERVGMRVQDETQLQYLFDRTWRSGRFDMSTMRAKGSGLVSSDATLPEKFKGWRIEPARVDAESITVGPWRPELDEASVARCDVLTVDAKDSAGYKTKVRVQKVYSGRWDRTLPVVFPAAKVRAGARASEAAMEQKPVPEHRDETPREQAPSLGDALADLEAGRQRLRDVEPVPDPGPSEADLPPLPDGADFSVVEGWLESGAPATDESGRRKPMPRIRMRRLVWDSGEQGIGPTAVHKALEAERYATTYQTVNGWMKDDTKAGLLDQAGDRAPYTRGPKMTDPYAGQG